MIPLSVSSPSKEDRNFRLARSPCWMLIIGLGILDRVIEMNSNPYDPSGLVIWNGLTVISTLAIAYARTKDIGYHGAVALWAIVPCGMIVLACIPTDYVWADAARKTSFRKKAAAWWIGIVAFFALIIGFAVNAEELTEEPVLVHQFLIEYCVAVIDHSNDPAFGPASDWLQAELGEDFDEDVADMFYTNMAIMLSNGELDPAAIQRAAAECSSAYKTVITDGTEEQSSGSRDEIPPIP